MTNSIVRKIKEWLLSYETVSLTGLGIFQVRKNRASIHPILHECQPPQNELVFEYDENCENTTEFVEFLQKESHGSTASAHEEVNEFVRKIKEALSREKIYQVEEFGEFVLNAANQISFTCADQVFLNHAEYGLHVFQLDFVHVQDRKPFVAPVSPLTIEESRTNVDPEVQIEEFVEQPDCNEISAEAEPPVIEEPMDAQTMKHEDCVNSEEFAIQGNQEMDDEKSESADVAEQQDVIEVVDTKTDVEVIPEEIRKSNTKHVVKKKRKKLLMYVVVFTLIVGGGSTVYFSGYWEVIFAKYKNMSKKVTDDTIVVPVVQENIHQESEPDIQNDTVGVVEPLVEEVVAKPEIAAESAQLTQESSLQYFIVADCFRDPVLAANRVKALQSQGYASCLAGQTKEGLHIVAYSGFADKESAQVELEKIRRTVKKESWLYVK